LHSKKKLKKAEFIFFLKFSYFAFKKRRKGNIFFKFCITKLKNLNKNYSKNVNDNFIVLPNLFSNSEIISLVIKNGFPNFFMQFKKDDGVSITN